MKTIIDSQQLRVFHALARTLNMTRTAEELGITTSAVSHCVKALEQDLGGKLFERHSRQTRLAPAGEVLLRASDDILSRMKDARARVRLSGEWRSGQLRIGTTDTACLHILPPVLREFRESFPDYTIKIEQCTPRDALAYLLDERLDLALLTQTDEQPRLDFFPVGEDDFQFFVHPLHPWAAKRKAIREEIPQRKLILPEKGSSSYALIERYFREEELQVKPFIEIASEEAMKQFVQLDMGIGILPRWVAASEVAKGLLVGLPLGRRALQREWGIYSIKNRRLCFAENLFLSVSRAVFQNLARPVEE